MNRLITDARSISFARSTTLWFGALGGAIAWTLHLMLSYIIAEFGCETDTDAHMYAGIMLPAWLLLGLSAILLLASAGATWSSFHCRRRLLRNVHAAANRRVQAEMYLARAGLMSSGLFTFVIAVQTIPIFFYLQRC